MNNRDRFIDKLKSARPLVVAYFDPPGCDWSGRFHAEQKECRQCADASVCSWIFGQDPAPDLSAFSEDELNDALVYAAGFLESEMFVADHDSESCSCAICVWVRDAKSVLECATDSKT